MNLHQKSYILAACWKEAHVQNFTSAALAIRLQLVTQVAGASDITSVFIADMHAAAVHGRTRLDYFHFDSCERKICFKSKMSSRISNQVCPKLSEYGERTGLLTGCRLATSCKTRNLFHQRQESLQTKYSLKKLFVSRQNMKSQHKIRLRVNGSSLVERRNSKTKGALVYDDVRSLKYIPLPLFGGNTFGTPSVFLHAVQRTTFLVSSSSTCFITSES